MRDLRRLTPDLRNIYATGRFGANLNDTLTYLA